MKFKTIFVLFNIVVLSAFLFILFMPLIILGSEFHSAFLQNNAVIALIFIIALIGLNSYFILNWKLYEHLEKEDWASLEQYLYTIIFEKNKFSTKNIKLFINTSLVLSKLENLENLQKLLKSKSPGKIAPLALELGLPYIINQRSQEGLDFFSEYSQKVKGEKKAWLNWAEAFCHLNLKEVDRVKEKLVQTLSLTKKTELILLSVYLLASVSSGDAEIEKVAQTYKTWLTDHHSRENIEKLLFSAKERNILILLFTKVYSEAVEWIYEEMPSKN